MARTGRPGKPVEEHKRAGTFRLDRHKPKPMLAVAPLVRPAPVYVVPFADHQYVCPNPDCAAGGLGVVCGSVVALRALRHRGAACG